MPIVQRWLDKWFWRGLRLLSLVGTMMDYFLPKRVMSWAEAWETYAEENGRAPFRNPAPQGCATGGNKAPGQPPAFSLR